MPTIASPPDARVLLHNISWETYQRLLAERGHSPGTRFTYDEGELEIMVVYIGHEGPNRRLADLVLITAEETGRDYCPSGSITCARKDLAKAFEPDSSFYFRHAKRMRAIKEQDLAVDPAPELVIEVDMTRSSLPRFPIFAAVGVEEVWRYEGEQVHFCSLEGKTYRPISESRVIPPMTAAQATLFLESSSVDGAPAWTRAVREWIRGQK